MTTMINASENPEQAVSIPSVWVRPATRPDAGLGNRTGEDIAEWDELVRQVVTAAAGNGWTKAEVARRVGMPDGTFSQWFSGTYQGQLRNQNMKVAQWLEALRESANLSATIPVKPPFQRTKIAVEIIDTLALAQATGDMVMITLEAGSGKTESCRHYQATRPHVYLVTASPRTRTVHGILLELADELEVGERNPARIVRSIGRKLERVGDGTLLIIDEAQNLSDEAMNQLRHFVDVQGCGLALVGNDEIYGRLSRRHEGASYAQLKSRIGKRLKRTKPYREDLEMRIAAWGVEEPQAVKFLTGIGLKAGALRQIDKTMLLAGMFALGVGVGLKHIRAAWRNRDVEEMA